MCMYSKQQIANIIYMIQYHLWFQAYTECLVLRYTQVLEYTVDKVGLVYIYFYT